VAINASSEVFQSYKSGVITSWECSTDINHAVTVVGYNKNNGDEPFYRVRNSWGSLWGDSGYVNIGMVMGDGQKGICGIN
jgi:C1A family cysteine protease